MRQSSTASQFEDRLKLCRVHVSDPYAAAWILPERGSRRRGERCRPRRGRRSRSPIAEQGWYRKRPGSSICGRAPRRHHGALERQHRTVYGRGVPLKVLAKAIAKLGYSGLNRTEVRD